MSAPAEAAVPAQSYANASPAGSDASAPSLGPAETTVTFPPPVLGPQQPVELLVAEPPSTPPTGDQSQPQPPTVQQPITPQPPPTTPQPVVGSGSTPVVTPDNIPATGEFAVKNGKIYAPDGQQFQTKGINVFPGQVDAATLLATLPGLNAVRLAATPGTDPGTIDALVQGLTSHGVVVEIEDHSSPGAAFAPNGNNVLTGSALDAEAAWYAGLADRYRNNSHVWFGTANEPDAPGNPGSIAQQEIAIYNAVRGAGNKTMVMLSERGGFTTDFAQPYAADYAKMSNVAWDSHYYGWVSDFSTKQADIFTSFSNQIANAQSIRSADGLVPVVIGEYGTSTTGSGQDANGTQVVQMVGDSKIGGMAWAWNAGTDALTSGSNTLTPFGQQVLNSFSAK